MNSTLFRSKEQCKKSHSSEEELVSQFVQSGQSHFIGQLYTKCSDRVYHQCLYLVKDPELARDYTHDIFLKLFSKLSGFSRGSRFSTWLFRVTYNYCMDQHRARGHRVQVPIENCAEVPGEDPWVNYLQDEAGSLNMLMLTFSLLPAEEQMILRMRYADNLSLRVISMKYDITVSAAKMRLLRSRNRLRDVCCKAR